MKQTQWTRWLEENEKGLPVTVRAFLSDATLQEVNENEITFMLRNTKVTFKKLSVASWTMPSSLFVPYGSLSGIFTGLNLLIEENEAA